MSSKQGNYFIFSIELSNNHINTELFYSTMCFSPILKPLSNPKNNTPRFHLFSLDDEITPLIPFSLDIKVSIIYHLICLHVNLL